MSKGTTQSRTASTATITSKGQVTVPADVREALNVGAGDQLRFEPAGPDHINVRVLRRPTVDEVAGQLRKGARGDDLQVLRRDAYRQRGKVLERRLRP